MNYSICIKHKNMSGLLQRCLDSIPQRTDLEIIIVDDNSDPSLVDFDNFPGNDRSDVRLFFTKTNKGAGHAWNVGMDEAIGKWVILADADDFFTDELNVVLDKYIRSNDHDVVMFPIKTVDSETLQPHDRDSNINQTIFNARLDDRQKLSLFLPGWSKIIKRSFLNEFNIRCDEVRVSNDIMFGARIAVHAQKIKIDIDNTIYTLTYRKSSLTTLRNFDNVYLRTKIDVQKNRFYKENGHKEWRQPIPCLFLLKQPYYTFFQKCRLIWLIIKNGYLPLPISIAKHLYLYYR